jgi:hypothetical protein
MHLHIGGQIDAHDFHFVGFNEQSLRDLLLKAGFSQVLRVPSLGIFQDTSEFKPYGFPISLNVIAN